MDQRIFRGRARYSFSAVAVAIVVFANIANVNAQNNYIGEIKMFAGNFAPTGWAFCDGQLLPISQNTALFSILGTTYGGDGKTNFVAVGTGVERIPCVAVAPSVGRLKAGVLVTMAGAVTAAMAV